MQRSGCTQLDLVFMYLAGKGALHNYVWACMWPKIPDLPGDRLMIQHLHLVAGNMSGAEVCIGLLLFDASSHQNR